MMMRSPPRPVSVPPTEVASRRPCRVVATSLSLFLPARRMAGNASRYQGVSTTARKLFMRLAARSWRVADANHAPGGVVAREQRPERRPKPRST